MHRTYFNCLHLDLKYIYYTKFKCTINDKDNFHDINLGVKMIFCLISETEI